MEPAIRTQTKAEWRDVSRMKRKNHSDHLHGSVSGQKNTRIQIFNIPAHTIAHSNAFHLDSLLQMLSTTSNRVIQSSWFKQQQEWGLTSLSLQSKIQSKLCLDRHLHLAVLCLHSVVTVEVQLVSIGYCRTKTFPLASFSLGGRTRSTSLCGSRVVSLALTSNRSSHDYVVKRTQAIQSKGVP